jgi:hypothetical protein
MDCYHLLWNVCSLSLSQLALDLRLAALTYLQGYRARSWIEYSLMKKSVHLIYHFTVF